jgi:acetate---CoA ligase (ADP-forming) subunit beta
MLRHEIRQILGDSKETGWVLEPAALRILSLQGLTGPRFHWAKTKIEALEAAEEIGYPVVAKIVSPKILHKSDVGGVVMNITDKTGLASAFNRFEKLEGFQGVVVEEMLPAGLELIVGARQDFQFGPVVLVGIGGTSVEIYKDTALRLAPLTEKDVLSMINQLKARDLLVGYRGSAPINIKELIHVITAFSELLMDMEGFFESIDLNPVICTKDRCVIADARIILPSA